MPVSPDFIGCSFSWPTASAQQNFMRAAWPLLWLFPAFAAAAFAAARVAGLPAAALALVFSAVSVAGLEQFRPGRIDHHNVQIALAVIERGCDRVVGHLAHRRCSGRVCSPAQCWPRVLKTRRSSMLAGAAMAAAPRAFRRGRRRDPRVFGLALAATAVVCC